jgi:hypothetical protein
VNEFDDIELPADFDDLSKHAPLLHELRGRGDSFVVPEGYFGESVEILLAKTALPSEDGFLVPENYFETLASRLASLVNLPSEKNSGFEVPENYFEKFTDEIGSIVSLHDLKSGDGFETPENYFSELDSELPTKIALDNLRQDEGFVIPEDYFEKFTAEVITRAAMSDVQEGSDADVPGGYFDTLADRVAARLENEGLTAKDAVRKGRVIVFAETLRRYSRTMAVAASAALLIAAGVWYMNRETSPAEKTIADKNKKPAPLVQPVPKPQLPVVETPVAQNPKPKSGKPLNHAPVLPVKTEKQDVMENIDQVDEQTLAEFVNEQTPARIKTDENFMDDPMMEYIMKDDADPTLLINTEIQKP